VLHLPEEPHAVVADCGSVEHRHHRLEHEEPEPGFGHVEGAARIAVQPPRAHAITRAAAPQPAANETDGDARGLESGVVADGDHGRRGVGGDELPLPIFEGHAWHG